MFLAIDVGNSNIHLGLFKQPVKTELPKFIRNFVFMHNKNVLKRLSAFLQKQNNLQGIILSDAYGATSILKQTKFRKAISVLRKQLSHFIVLTPSLNSGLKIKYHPKSSLGTDRIANCVAAYTIYNKNCLVVDFGTATTYNSVSKTGLFLGGLIAPGINNLNISLPEHLVKKQKPIDRRINFRPNALAFSTSESIQSGIYYHLTGAIENTIRQIKQKSNKKLYTIATGGCVHFLTNIKNIFDAVDVNLTLKGLAIIYQRISEGR